MFRSMISLKGSKKFKRIMVFWLIIFGLILLIFPNVTYADTVSSLLWEQAYTKNVSDLIKMVSHIVYVFIWPCLVIAGTALDNSLVYGSFLHLDAALWNIWNIMKNFANFALWFLFVFTIVVNLFKGANGKSDPMENAIWTVKSTLLAGVLVQMSWFIVAVLIDLSTILIYAVWGLPLSMLWNYNKEVADVPIMKMNTEISDNDFFYYYSYWPHNYSPCLLINKEWDVKERINVDYLKWEYIAWRQKLYLSSWVKFDEWYCTLNWYLYKYQESSWFFADEGIGHYEETWSTLTDINKNYYNSLKSYIEEIAKDTGLVENEMNSCFFINAYGTDYAPGSECTPLCSWYWPVPYTGDVFASTPDGFTLETLLQKSKWWVWPFVTIYSSILNYQELVMNPDSGSAVWTLFGFIINTFFALILFLPMAILAILLVIRVWYLWIVVAISPILVLAYAFEKTKWDSPLKKLSELFWKRFSIKNVLMQIFSPVIVVFAISLCIIFLSTIYKTMPRKDLSAFGIQCIEDVEWEDWWNACVSEGKKCSYSILWLVTIKINAQNYNHGKDLFVWVLMELLATWIVRFFMKFAIDFIWKFWEKNRGKELMGMAEKYITTMPVLRLPWMNERVGLHAIGIGEWNSDAVMNRLNQKVRKLTKADEQENMLRDRLWGNDSKSTNIWVSEAIDYIRNNKNVTYNNLEQKYKDALSTVWYNANNFDTIANTIRSDNYWNVISAWTAVSKSESAWKTNAEAVRYTSAQMDIAVKTNAWWKAWASSIVWWSIELLDWVFIVDFVGGTKGTGNEQYRIVSREDYEREHFGAPVKNISQDDYNNMEETKKADLKRHFDELQEEIKQFNDIKQKLENKKELSDDEKQQQKSLENQQNGIASLTQEMIEEQIKKLWIK